MKTQIQKVLSLVRRLILLNVRRNNIMHACMSDIGRIYINIHKHTRKGRNYLLSGGEEGNLKQTIMKTEKEIKTNYENLKIKRKETYNLLMEDKDFTE